MSQPQQKPQQQPAPQTTAGRFRRGERSRVKLRMLIDGPAKSGKSFTALRLAFALAARVSPEARVAVIEAGERNDTEKYYGEEQDGRRWDFDITQLSTYSPDEYTAAIDDAARAGYQVVIIDSLSHEWIGKDGCLQMADKPGLFGGWKTATPLHDKMFETIKGAPCHIIATVRSKMDYVIQTNEKGKAEPVKIGLAPIQRDTAPYEFDILLSMDMAHVGTVSGSRCRAVEGVSVSRPGAAFMEPIIAWLETGVQGAAPTITPRINAVQVDRVAELLGQLGWPLDRISREFPRKFGVADLEKLNREQGNDLVKWLEAQLAGQHRRNQGHAAPPPQPAAPAVQAPIATPGAMAPTNGQNGPSATVVTPAVPASATTKLRKEQELQLRTLKGDLASRGMPADAWSKMLEKRGVKSARELTEAQADELIPKLRAKVAMLQHPSEKDAETAPVAPAVVAPTATEGGAADKPTSGIPF